MHPDHLARLLAVKADALSLVDKIEALQEYERTAPGAPQLAFRSLSRGTVAGWLERVEEVIAGTRAA